MISKITESVNWVGKIDWQIKSFHGNELSTHNGTSFNSYLITDEKNVLIDSVWLPFTSEFLKNISSIIEFKKIDYIIVNHSEPDHTGALPHLIAKLPDVPIYCTANGSKALKGHYHKDWNFKIVKNGDRLNIGSNELVFIEAPMLHWPDTMMCFLTGENILFSNDIFGQHYASEYLYDDDNDNCQLYYEAMKYYANIISPFSKKAYKKISELKELNLPIKLICPAHGIIWKNNPKKIIDLYGQWSDSYSENQITIIYDTMYNSTRKMAEEICNGIKSVDNQVKIKLFNASNTDKNDLVTEVFKSKGLIFGSPTLNGGVLSSIASLLEEIKGLNLTNKKAGAFGSYGWSATSIKYISDKLTECGFELVGSGVKSQWNPTEEIIAECFSYGQEFAKAK